MDISKMSYKDLVALQKEIEVAQKANKEAVADLKGTEKLSGDIEAFLKKHSKNIESIEE